jgi:twitching motility protein PilT
MAGVDQILHAIVQQGADELRLATDQAPLVFANGAARRFTMAPTPEPVLRQLLNQLLTAERLAMVERSVRVEFERDAGRAGRFVVALVRGAAGLEATFITAASAAARHPGAVSNPAEPAAPAPPVEVARGTAAGAPVARGTSEAEGVTVTERFIALVEQAAAARASDLHLAAAEPAYFRVDGRLERVPGAEIGLRAYLELAPAAQVAVEGGRALDIALELVGERRLRVSVYRMQAGLAAAVRLLPRTAPELDQLALPANLADLAELPHGLVLVAGATGSGKSTTVAALCRRALERRSVVLVTLEEPIEFALPSSPRSVARQRQIGRDVADFNTGLRDALRSDPDVIMVGELRDAETIRLALTAAETGHLVLASLHGGSAAGSIERIVDAYPAEHRPQIRTQLADALRAIIVQRLLPRARGTGRVAALEVLRVTHAVANVIREGKTAQIGSALQGGSKDGQLSLERCLADYVRANVISVENARAAANELDSLAMYLAK